MKKELIKFRKWWNENKSKLSIKITVRDIDDYLSTLSDEKEQEKKPICDHNRITKGGYCACCGIHKDYLKPTSKQESDEKEEKPKVICICGSTRFGDYHAIARWDLEKEGKNICLMINYLPEWYAEKEFGKGKHDHFGEIFGNKEILDKLHFKKIDISDEIFVININGYIGESTRNEINYALSQGKLVIYLEPTKMSNYEM